MDYKSEAIGYLKNIDNLNIARQNLRDEIRELREDIQSVKEISYSDMPKGGGLDMPSDKVLNQMLRLRRAEEEYSKTVRTLKRMEYVFKTFEETNPIYGKILKLYFIENVVEEQIMKELQYSDRHLRRLKNIALKTFAVQLFGIMPIGA